MKKKPRNTFLYGRVSIKERLKANPQSIKKIFLQENSKLDDIEQLAKKNGISLEYSSIDRLQSFKPVKDLQGVVAKAEAFKYADFEDLFDKNLSLILLDRINDPQNFGSILRTSACFKNFALIIPEFGACPVTDAVLHVASGAENYVPIVKVGNLTKCILKLKKAKYWIVGAEAEQNAGSLFNVKLPFPIAIVMGNENKGIRYGIRKHLDLTVSIPMKGTALSFNVAIAQAIIAYEIARQRK